MNIYSKEHKLQWEMTSSSKLVCVFYFLFYLFFFFFQMLQVPIKNFTYLVALSNTHNF